MPTTLTQGNGTFKTQFTVPQGSAAGGHTLRGAADTTSASTTVVVIAPSATPTPSAPAAATPTLVPTGSATATATRTATPPPTASPTSTATASPTPTATTPPTDTPAPTATWTPLASATPAATASPALTGPTASAPTFTPSPTVTSSGLALIYDDVTGYAPFDCFHEDSFRDRAWSGTLAAGEFFNLLMPYCNSEQFIGGPGGEGFWMKVTGRGQLSLTAVSPSGQVYQAYPVEASGSQLAFARCVVPLQLAFGTIEPGIWTLTLSNPGTQTVRDVTYQVQSYMASQGWQLAYCPPADWNF
jgi:hypothetical protein